MTKQLKYHTCTKSWWEHSGIGMLSWGWDTLWVLHCCVVWFGNMRQSSQSLSQYHVECSSVHERMVCLDWRASSVKEIINHNIDSLKINSFRCYLYSRHSPWPLSKSTPKPNAICVHPNFQTWTNLIIWFLTSNTILNLSLIFTTHSLDVKFQSQMFVKIIKYHFKLND
jgi:hypothetical protein